MKKVLIINGHQYYDYVAKGELTQKYINCANDFFIKNGFEVKHTHIEKGYDIEEECTKFEWADYILFQYPVYWMGLPWISKKYIDEKPLIFYTDGLKQSGRVERFNSFDNFMYHLSYFSSFPLIFKEKTRNLYYQMARIWYWCELML